MSTGYRAPSPAEEVTLYCNTNNVLLDEDQKATATAYYMARRLVFSENLSGDELVTLLGEREEIIPCGTKNRRKMWCRICKKFLSNDKGMFKNHCVNVHWKKDRMTLQTVWIPSIHND